ncbi:MAG: acyl-CoA dehydrogenase, partial [Rhodospirillales bacterium]|nr:acyl-CoA dehydrogenase [Rhodospirillales bacterium]
LAEHAGAWDDPVFQRRYAQLRLDLADHKALYETFADAVRRGETLGQDVSMLKLHQTELFQRITDAMLDVAGTAAGMLEPLEGNNDLNPSGQFIQARPATIYGGSNEIQRNVLAKNVLGL